MDFSFNNIFMYSLVVFLIVFFIVLLVKYIRIKKQLQQQNNNNNYNITSIQHYTPITNNLFAQMQFSQHPQQHPQYVKPNNQSPSHLFGLSTSPSHLGSQFPPPTSSVPSTSSSTTSEEWIFGQRYLEIIREREKEEKEEKEWEEYQNLIKDKMKREGFCKKCISEEIKPQHLAFIGCGHQFCYKCILRRSLSDKTCPRCEEPFDEIIIM
ncbi:hypothetical protein DICPUDRAFT_79276 [Dictyostelium purpureum]|uniref:RING-type domain-containing protein n=1 Tax=Dictyostelium purpureum TaxID=5786 RepID=F0ZM37_DICPU|nr:uncharacterized protein DICPUDRAFT_79276 [Dictyostelium purpureum]EGC34999.1 hypothetical protein DICPUDRAFT_79276 [Dictyostelium purpureum]|eukprot:XP_003288473.1 hypothetical protein DICPUDRAFT_79276 [Dictyostelium purpureum]